MLIGLSSILLGTSAMFVYKGSQGAPHYTTWHGTFGLITVSWLIVQFIVGASSVWFGGAVFGGSHRAKLVWKYHRLSGYILLLFLLTTVNLGGAWSSWVSVHSAYVVRLVAYTLAPLLILVSLYSRVRPSKMKFF
jgi:cytochrome b-561 domain-containing protein 2